MTCVVGLAGAAPVPLQALTVAVEGEVTDVVAGDIGKAATVVIASTTRDGRRLTLVDPEAGGARPGPAVPADAVAFDVCADGIVFVDRDGLVRADGQRILRRAPLLSVPDPGALLVADTCPGGGPERLLFVADGLALARVDAAGVIIQERLLDWPHRARGYSGRLQRGLRGERAYGAALSLYAPRLRAVDVDGDGDRDLVAFHEDRLAFFRRDEQDLQTRPEVRDLRALAGAPADADLRVRIDGRRVLVGVSVGAMPEKSRVVVIDGPPAAPWSRVTKTRSIDGLGLLLGGDGGGQPIYARMDTNLVTLSGVVLTGRVPLGVFVDDRLALTLSAAADVRAGRMDGALPVVDVDFDRDGTPDLLDLGVPKAATLYRRSGDTWTAGASVDVPRFRHAIALPSLAAVVLVGDGARGRTSLTLLRRASPTAAP